MKKILLITIIAALLVGTLSLAALAFGPGRGPGQGQAGGYGLYNNSLNLTADQQQKILAIQQDFQRDTQPLRFELQKKHLELRQLWTAKPLNQSAIEAKNKEVIAIKVQLVTKAQAMFDKIKSILTPEQQKQLGDFANFGPGFGGRGACAGGGRGCPMIR